MKRQLPAWSVRTPLAVADPAGPSTVLVWMLASASGARIAMPPAPSIMLSTMESCAAVLNAAGAHESRRSKKEIAQATAMNAQIPMASTRASVR